MQISKMALKTRSFLESVKKTGWSIWSDHCVQPGSEWDKDINMHLRSADVILILVSRDSMWSEYIRNTEMKAVLKRHDRHEACVIPILHLGRCQGPNDFR